MTELLCASLLFAMGGVSLDSLTLTGAPVDVGIEWRPFELREALTANTGRPRLILYLRDLESVGMDREHVVRQLPNVFPLASVHAEARTRDGSVYPLTLVDYSFFRGMPGLVLEGAEVTRGTTFYSLRLRAARPIERAVMIWLDSLGRSRPD